MQVGKLIRYTQKRNSAISRSVAYCLKIIINTYINIKIYTVLRESATMLILSIHGIHLNFHVMLRLVLRMIHTYSVYWKEAYRK